MTGAVAWGATRAVCAEASRRGEAGRPRERWQRECSRLEEAGQADSEEWGGGGVPAGVVQAGALSRGQLGGRGALQGPRGGGNGRNTQILESLQRGVGQHIQPRFGPDPWPLPSRTTNSPPSSCCQLEADALLKRRGAQGEGTPESATSGPRRAACSAPPVEGPITASGRPPGVPPAPSRLLECSSSH